MYPHLPCCYSISNVRKSINPETSYSKRLYNVIFPIGSPSAIALSLNNHLNHHFLMSASYPFNKKRGVAENLQGITWRTERIELNRMPRNGESAEKVVMTFRSKELRKGVDGRERFPGLRQGLKAELIRMQILIRGMRGRGQWGIGGHSVGERRSWGRRLTITGVAEPCCLCNHPFPRVQGLWRL